jgi:hypothetical protein
MKPNTTSAINGRLGGRPKGSTKKPHILDFITLDTVNELVLLAVNEAKAGKTDMLKFVLEQVLGRPPQNISLGEDGSGIVVNMTVNKK